MLHQQTLCALYHKTDVYFIYCWYRIARLVRVRSEEISCRVFSYHMLLIQIERKYSQNVDCFY